MGRGLCPSPQAKGTDGIVKEKEVFRIKQYFIWIGLLARRLLRQPAYIGLLLLIPVAGGAVGLLERSAGGGAVVAV